MTRLASFPTSAPDSGNLAYAPGVGANSKIASFPGDTSSFAASVDTVRNSHPGDLDIRVHLALADWNVLGADMCLICKQQQPSNKSWVLKLDNNGRPQFLASTLGALDDINQVATAAPPFADNAFGWVRVRANATSGLISHLYSLDGAVWTLNGGGVTAFAGAFDSSADIVVGVESSASNPIIPLTGLVERGIVYAGLEDTFPIITDFSPIDHVRREAFKALTTKEIWNLFGSINIS